jgi:hypothetical protein
MYRRIVHSFMSGKAAHISAMVKDDCHSWAVSHMIARVFSAMKRWVGTGMLLGMPF